jgi:uncharacterized membrane protein
MTIQSQPIPAPDEKITPLERPSIKAIPPARDRLQSTILVWIAIPTLCYLTLKTFHSIVTADGWAYLLLDHTMATLVKTTAVSIAFACLVWLLKASTPLGAVCGGMMCLLIAEFSQGLAKQSLFQSGITPLALLFVLTFIATRLGRKQKAAAGLAEGRKGRSAAQVVANLGTAALFSSLWGENISGWLFTVRSGSFGFAYSGREGHILYMHVLWLPMLAALAEATADTVSSEIGQAFGGQPILLTTLRRVPPGTDGAVTLLGTLAGVAAAAVVALSAIPAMGLSLSECAVALTAGVAGLFFDSLLGATVERRGWLGNDLVNLSSTAFAAALSLLLLRLTQPILRN